MEPSERMEEEVVEVDTVTTDAPTTAEEELEISEKEEGTIMEKQTKLEGRISNQTLPEETAESDIKLPDPEPEPDPALETELELEQEPETEAASLEQPAVEPEPEEPETEAASSEQPEVEPETEGS